MNERSEVETALRRFSGAFFKRDLDALEDCVTAGFEWRFALGPDTPDGSVYRGIDGMKRGFEERDRLMQGVRYDDVSTAFFGNRALMEYRVTGTFIEGGPFDVRGIEILTFEDGRLALKDVYWKQYRTF